MPPVVERPLPRLAPPDPAVLAEALAGAPGRARHHGLAVRIPALDALELCPPPAPAPVPAVLGIAAWNAERLKHAAASAAGFAWVDSNTAHVTSRTRPDGEPLPPFTRIDWLLVRGLSARTPATVPALGPDGHAISDHDLVAADVLP